ncbi:MAG: sorbosone dehydrogenase family protein [Methylohalobius sp.]|nr:sorbosone dehydrogenase family protein [Methylohalobius sp.]
MIRALVWLTIAWACGAAAANDPLALIKLPAGFRIELFAQDVPNARSLALGEDGTVYVGSMKAGKVYALRDEDGDGQAEHRYVLAEGLTMPNGVAVYRGDLYVAEVSKIMRFKDIAHKLSAPPKPEVVIDTLPTDLWHGWKYLRVGPDGKLYFNVGAPCNVCVQDNEIYATLVRVDPDGKNLEIFARGVRNSVGFDWHPKSQALWFTDNGRDWLGDDRPPDELNRAAKAGLHFGFPHCHSGDIPDPEYGKDTECKEFTPPAWRFGAHVAPLGARFYTGTQFPAQYRGQLFVAQHGSWNRTKPVGYRVVFLEFKDEKPVAEHVFAEGWLQPDGKVLGRPVDILQLKDGSLLVSDDQRGVIYRIYYRP